MAESLSKVCPRTGLRPLLAFGWTIKMHAMGAKEIALPRIISRARVYNSTQSCLHFGRSRGTGDISHGKSFTTIAVGCFVYGHLRAGVGRSRKENGNAGEGLEFEPDAGPLRRLDARRPSGHRDAVLDLQAESGGAPDVAVGPGEIQRGQIVLRSARISHRGNERPGAAAMRSPRRAARLHAPLPVPVHSDARRNRHAV